MPTTLPRKTGTFTKETAEILDALAKERGVSVGKVITDLVTAALEFVEDFSLTEIGSERLKTLDKSKSLSTAQLLAWNTTRKV